MNAGRSASATAAKRGFWGHRARLALSAAVVFIAVPPTVASVVRGAPNDSLPTQANVMPDGTVGSMSWPAVSAVDTNDSRPHVLEGEIAPVLVEIRGGRCTGTPITGTKLVVTAAHCVLWRDGELIRRTVVRDDVQYDPVAVLVDTDYHLNPNAQLDAAVLVMSEVIPGPSAQLGESLPQSGLVTLAGFQPVDNDGSLLRGSGPHDLPRPQGDEGNIIRLQSRPAGCVEPAELLEVSTSHVVVHCGLIPGASGGGLFAQGADGPVLVGIVSNVTADLTANGVVPLSSLHELLQHPGRYTHLMLTIDNPRDHMRSLLS